MITRKVVDQHKTSQFINDLKAKSSSLASVQFTASEEEKRNALSVAFYHYYVLLVIHLSVCIWMFNIL